MRPTFLPFALPDTDDNEINEVAEAIRSGWVTTGPKRYPFDCAPFGFAHLRQVASPAASLPKVNEVEGLDVIKAEQLFGFRSRVSFEEGLPRTIAWYQANIQVSSLLPVQHLEMQVP